MYRFFCSPEERVLLVTKILDSVCHLVRLPSVKPSIGTDVRVQWSENGASTTILVRPAKSMHMEHTVRCVYILCHSVPQWLGRLRGPSALLLALHRIWPAAGGLAC